MLFSILVLREPLLIPNILRFSAAYIIPLCCYGARKLAKFCRFDLGEYGFGGAFEIFY